MSLAGVLGTLPIPHDCLLKRWKKRKALIVALRQDSTGSQWQSGALVGKAYSSFVSTGTQGGGQARGTPSFIIA